MNLFPTKRLFDIFFSFFFPEQYHCPLPLKVILLLCDKESKQTKLFFIVQLLIQQEKGIQSVIPNVVWMVVGDLDLENVFPVDPIDQEKLVLTVAILPWGKKKKKLVPLIPLVAANPLLDKCLSCSFYTLFHTLFSSSSSRYCFFFSRGDSTKIEREGPSISRIFFPRLFLEKLGLSRCSPSSSLSSLVLLLLPD